MTKSVDGVAGPFQKEKPEQNPAETFPKLCPEASLWQHGNNEKERRKARNHGRAWGIEGQASQKHVLKYALKCYKDPMNLILAEEKEPAASEKTSAGLLQGIYICV